MRPRLSAALLAATFCWAARLGAQEAIPPRPPEGDWIINLPSADVPRQGTLTILFTHRFAQPVEESDIHSLFSFDSGADIGIGLAYSPLPKLEVSFDRSSNLDVYELAAKYRLLSLGPVGLSLRAGGDWRTETGLIFDAAPGYSRRSFFAQGIAAVTLFERVRVSAVPTYVSETSGQPLVTPKSSYKNVFNVPVGVSVAVTRTVNVQGEVTPRYGRADAAGVGWIASVEKTVPRHRFSFTVGSQRGTTVDQYASGVPFGRRPHDYFLGFNLARQWNLK